MGSLWMFLAEVSSVGAVFVAVGVLLRYLLGKTVESTAVGPAPCREPMSAMEETP